MQKVSQYIIAFIAAIIFVFILNVFIIQGAVVKQQNMAPVLQKNDRVIVNKVKVTFNILKHGDVVMFRQHGDLKFSRIVGMAGESVEVKQGQLYRDDRQIKASYAKNIKTDFQLRNLPHSEGDIIPPDKYLVLSDDSRLNKQSQSYQLIDKKDIIGDVNLTYYPFHHFRYNYER